jgi:hypothetical protein
VSGPTVHVAQELDNSSVIVTGADAVRAVIFKRDSLKGCKKTSGTIVGDRGVVAAGGGRAARCRLI